jgi:hypothetical protein
MGAPTSFMISERGAIVEMRNTKSGASARMASTRFWQRFVADYIFAGFMECEIGRVDLGDRSRPRCGISPSEHL